MRTLGCTAASRPSRRPRSCRLCDAQLQRPAQCAGEITALHPPPDERPLRKALGRTRAPRSTSRPPLMARTSCMPTGGSPRCAPLRPWSSSLVPSRGAAPRHGDRIRSSRPAPHRRASPDFSSPGNVRYSRHAAFLRREGARLPVLHAHPSSFRVFRVVRGSFRLLGALAGLPPREFSSRFSS